jgi:hypothetical protein
MRIAPVVCLFSVLAAAGIPAMAEPPINSFSVNLPYSVAAGDQHLAAGKYVFREISRYSSIFAVFKDGQTFETFLLARPVDSVRPAEKTDVLLQSDGDEFTIDQIQVAGSNVAYEFAMPQAAISRQNERTGKSGF